MPRVRKDPGEATTAKDNASTRIRGRNALGVMYRPTHTKKARSVKARGVSKKVATQYMAELEKMLEDGDITAFSPRHWTALFCWIHEAVYEVSCLDEVRTEWNVSSAQAARLLTDEFGGEEPDFYDYLLWVSRREEDREQWRRKNQKSGGRLQWRNCFLQRNRLTEYRLDKARTGGPQ